MPSDSFCKFRNRKVLIPPDVRSLHGCTFSITLSSLNYNISNDKISCIFPEKKKMILHTKIIHLVCSAWGRGTALTRLLFYLLLFPLMYLMKRTKNNIRSESHHRAVTDNRDKALPECSCCSHQAEVQEWTKKCRQHRMLL